MLLFVIHHLWSIIGDSSFVVSLILPSAVTVLSFHRSTGKLGLRPLVNGVCECADYPRAPGNLCAHRLAYGIARRAAERTPALPAPVETEASSPAAAGVTPDQDYLGNVETPAPPLPEAPASVNVRLTIGGREVQLTLRDTSEERLLVRLEEVLQRFPLPQPQAQPSPQQLSPQQHNAAAMHRKVVDFCPIHNCAMKENTKDGRRWFSHYDETAGRWCKGR